MPVDLNDPELAPVSFLRGGLTIGGQVHLEGTYAFLPKEMAEWNEEMQLAKLRDVFFAPGIRRGFPPASQSYLSPEFRERIEREIQATMGATPVTAAPRPSESPPPEPVGAAVVGQQTIKAGPDSLQAQPIPTLAELIEEPFPGAATLVEPELRALLAGLGDVEIEQFIAWERSRPNPRQALLDELES